jgi:hypothetical protein
MQPVGPIFGVELRVINLRDLGAVQRGIAKIASLPNAGLVVTSSSPAAVARNAIAMRARAG